MYKFKTDILNLLNGETYIYALIRHSTYWSNGVREMESLVKLYLHQELAEKVCKIGNELTRKEKTLEEEDYGPDSFSVEKFYINFKEVVKDENIKYNLVTCKLLPLLLNQEIYLITSEFYDSSLERNIFLNKVDADSHCKMLQNKFEQHDEDAANYYGYEVVYLRLSIKDIHFT